MSYILHYSNELVYIYSKENSSNESCPHYVSDTYNKVTSVKWD